MVMIMKITKKYRVALMKSGKKYFTFTHDSDVIECSPDERRDFIEWLTDWIEYSVDHLEKDTL